MVIAPGFKVREPSLNPSKVQKVFFLYWVQHKNFNLTSYDQYFISSESNSYTCQLTNTRDKNAPFCFAKLELKSGSVFQMERFVR